MPDPKLQAYMDATVLTLVDARDQVTTALRLITSTLGNKGDPQPLQLLALRRYLRIGGKKISANWSWSEEEAKSKRQTEPTKSLYDEAEKVRATFTAQNPGHSLALSPVRSLERQITLWNSNLTVQAAGTDLAKKMLKLLEERSYPHPPSGAAVSAFRSKLSNAVVAPEPSNAAPGTSDHGRGTAVDFVGMKGASIIANTFTSQIPTQWKKAGWEAKLIAACKGTKLKGPLQVPYEPWHWIYRP